MDYEDETYLVHAVVTIQENMEDCAASLCFIDDRTGSIIKQVPLPTWAQVIINSFLFVGSLIHSFVCFFVFSLLDLIFFFFFFFREQLTQCIMSWTVLFT